MLLLFVSALSSGAFLAVYEVLYFNVRVSLSLFLYHGDVELHAWKIRCFKNKVIFNLQILYANEAESINPVEKDKEDPQSEVFIVEFTPRVWAFLQGEGAPQGVCNLDNKATWNAFE